MYYVHFCPFIQLVKVKIVFIFYFSFAMSSVYLNFLPHAISDNYMHTTARTSFTRIVCSMFFFNYKVCLPHEIENNN